LRGQPLPRVFIVYEHKLFKDILANVLGQESIVGAAERVAGPFEATIEAIRSIGPDVVILEVEADGNNAWRILLASGEARRVVVLDMDKGLIHEYAMRTSAIRTIEELSALIGTT